MKSKNIKHFVFDFETLGTPPDGIVLELSAIVFDPSKPLNYTDLVNSGIKIKFGIKDQKTAGRIMTEGAKEFWKNQPKDLQKRILLPSDDDKTLKEGLTEFMSYLKDNGIDPWKSIGWCRGQSFDFPMLVSIIREVYGIEDTFEKEPIKFWNQRDTRTFISGATGDFGRTNIPLLISELPGFVHHDSIHDCAKDIIMIKKAMDLANGGEFDFDPNNEYLEASLK